jgi:cardiolipin synthase
MGAIIGDALWAILLAINYSLVILFSILIVLRNSNPVKTFSYLFALATLPFLGLLVYYLFGQDYRKDKIFRKKYALDDDKLRTWKSGLLLNSVELTLLREQYGEAPYRIYRLMRENSKAPLTFGNEVEILVNGEKKFSALKSDLAKARHHIHLEYFVVFDDELGSEILDILCAKAAEGVIVRLIYDDVGSKLSRRTKQKLTASGVHHFPFMPVLYPRFTGKLNYRDHRKIVVIDGETGYVGGINIRKKYDNSFADNERYWRDTHIRIKGAAVIALQATFLLSWDFVSGNETGLADVYFPKSVPAGKEPIAVQIAASGPDTDWANIMEAMFTAISGAEKYIYITTPYLIPNEAILTALTTAGRSGIDVRILIPYDSDSVAAQYATDSYIEQLVKSKVRIYRYKKGFVHSKTMVIDDHFISVGTANLDYRSFSINFEINALIYNESKACEMRAIFEDDLREAEVVDPEAWIGRGLKRKLMESFSRLWAPLL